MIAADPLSLLFLACIVFSGAFLIISMVSGLGHGIHFGGHVAHAGHIAHAGHPAHTIRASDDASHVPSTHHAVAAPAQTSALATIQNAFISSLNLYSILVFLLIFGLLGYLFHNATNLGAVLSIVLALLIGDGCAISLGLLLTRLFVSNAPHELAAESSRLEGRLGHVSMAIHEHGVGEVIFVGAAGGRQSIGARSLDGATIPVDAEVVILSYDDGIATVQQWETFITGLRSGTAPELAPIHLPS